ncbi:phosphopantetheine-binding protein [Burkholderia pseudomallei]
MPSYMVPSAYVRLDIEALTAERQAGAACIARAGGRRIRPRRIRSAAGCKRRSTGRDLAGAAACGARQPPRRFFELGGHSLLAVQLGIAPAAELSVEVALSTVFDAPVLSALASRLDDNTAESCRRYRWRRTTEESRCRWRSNGYGS